MKALTHVTKDGSARMVDVGGKEITQRKAVAQAVVTMQPATLALIVAGNAPKGDVLAAARIAGIMAAKQTSALIPLCHPLPIDSVEVALTPQNGNQIYVKTTVQCTYKTGVEMEALTAASVAALTIYDMCKAVDRAVEISGICLLKKSGGKNGAFVRDQAPQNESAP
jgi:cyclic pyranopterin phosphate synthase